MAYFRLATSRALTETTTFWSIHRVWAYLSVPASGLVLRVIIRGKGQLNGWKEIAEFVFFGFVFSWTGTYVINLMIRVPALLYGGQARRANQLEKEKLSLQAQLDGLKTEPKVSEEDQYKRDLVARKLQDLGFTRDEKRFLRFLSDHGELEWGKYELSGCSPQAITGAIQKGDKALLIFQKHTKKASESGARDLPAMQG